jgi:O-antigen/teichoic acid export membrane protein
VVVSPSVWALLAGHLTVTVLRVLTSQLMLPGGRNWFAWDRSARTDLMGFGRWVMVSTIVTFLAVQGDRLILGYVGTMTQLGVYGIALLLVSFAIQLVQQMGSSVVFPAYSAVLNAGRPLGPAFARVRRPLVLGGGVLLTGMIGAGPAIVQILYQPAYHGAGWMLQILGLGAWFQLLTVTTGSALLAMGHAKAVASGNVAKLAALAGLLGLGWAVWGLPGAIGGAALAELVKYLVLGASAERRGLRVFGADAGLTAVFGGIAAGVWLLGVELGRLGWPPVAVCAATGAATLALWAPVALRSLGGWKGVRRGVFPESA